MAAKAVRGVNVPWTLLAICAIGVWLMFTRLTLGAEGAIGAGQGRDDRAIHLRPRAENLQGAHIVFEKGAACCLRECAAIDDFLNRVA